MKFLALELKWNYWTLKKNYLIKVQTFFFSYSLKIGNDPDESGEAETKQ